jgi:JmjC domain
VPSPNTTLAHFFWAGCYRSAHLEREDHHHAGRLAGRPTNIDERRLPICGALVLMLFSLSQTLLGGAEEGDFLATRWKSAFAHFPGAATGMADLLPGISDVARILSGPTWDSAAMVSYLSLPSEGTATHHYWMTPAPGARESTRAVDESVNIGDADRWFPALRPLVAALGARFHATIHAQLFLSEAGRGVRPHADIFDSFVVQIAGRKRWRVANPSVEAPVSVVGPFALPHDADTYDLEPGDVLYVPSHGTHGTRAVDDRSLSLSLSIVTHTAADAVLELVRRCVLADSRWSQGMPLSTRGRARLAEAVAELAEQIRSEKAL